MGEIGTGYGPQGDAPGAMRRGACPTLSDPLATGDGLLARFRPVGNRLSLEGLSALAAAARRFGNGQVEVTARGSVQVRGVRADGVRGLETALREAIDVETGVPVETPPLAGLEPGIDARGLAERLRLAIAARGLVLSPKVSVIVDGSGGLDGISADVRLRAGEGGWTLGFAGSQALVEGDDAAISGVMVALDAIAGRGAMARGRDFGGTGVRESAEPLLGEFVLGGSVSIVGIGLGFGGVDAATLDALAATASGAGVDEMRVAPGRTLYCVGGDSAALAKAAAAIGLIVQRGDPRAAIAACAGQRGCASGLIDARGVAGELAEAMADMLDRSFTLHVSGCAKGCAHPRAAGVTLVGTESGLAVILRGSARDTGIIELSRETVVARFAALQRLFLERRHAQESARDWLDRFGAEAVARCLAQGLQ